MKYLLAWGLLLVGISLLAQEEEYPYPSLSPKGNISQIVGNTLIEIEYERPSVRQRKIFGHLVPWNKVWRTGAGYCTKIKFDKAVEIAGQRIPAGQYSLFSIPKPEEWVIILNTDTNLYGSYDYDSEKDVIRLLVPSKHSGRFYETLTIDVDLIPNNARIYISWDHTQVSFDVITTTDQEIKQFITKELISGKSQNSDHYAGGADYYLYQHSNLMEAIELAEKAIKLNPENGWARRVKIEIYEYLHLYGKAQMEINEALEMTRKRSFEKEEDRAAEIKSWKEYSQRIKELQN